MVGRYLLRIRGLRTNFYTYQGVVKALDGIDLDVREGETVGIVGETGCGKSVTALSVLRLIPQPPGKIEAGEALVDVDEETLAEIDRLRSDLRGSLREILGGDADYGSVRVTIGLVARVEEALRTNRSMDRSRITDLTQKAKRLKGLLASHDLLSMSEEELQATRGGQISMIFQEPMQALNPVFTVGDQIAESIVLHRRRWLFRRITLRMRAELLRKRVREALRQAFPEGTSIPAGVDIEDPSPADLRVVLKALPGRPGGNGVLVQDVRTLIALEGITGREGTSSSVFSRMLSKRMLRRLYERECLRTAWKAVDVIEELRWLAGVLRETGGEVAWSDARAKGSFEVTLTPAAGLSAKTLAARLQEVLGATKGPTEAWSVLGKVLGPPRPEDGHVVVTVQPPYRKARTPLDATWLGRIPFLKRSILRPQARMAIDEAARVLRLLKIGDADRVVTMYPHELSGGMNQRAMIGIALACDPILLIADEPSTALDVTIQAQILELLRELKSKGRPSLLLITHDLGVIAEMCDRVAVMYGGHVIENAPLREIFKSPLHPYTQGLLRAIPSHTERKDRLDVIKGSVPNLIYPPSGCRFHPRCPAVMPHCGWDTKDLEPVVRKYADALGLDPNTIVAVDDEDPYVLRMRFEEGNDAVQAMAAIEAKVEQERPSSVLLQAVTAVRREGPDLVFTMLKARKPSDWQVSPGHMVACYLYEPKPEVA